MGVVVLSDSYKVEKDSKCWMLHTAYEGKDKNGNKKTNWHTTFHASLKQVADRVCSREAEEANSLHELLQAFEDAASRIENCIEGMVEVDHGS